jgi:hypothetical protein
VATSEDTRDFSKKQLLAFFTERLDTVPIKIWAEILSSCFHFIKKCSKEVRRGKKEGGEGRGRKEGRQEGRERGTL